MAAQNCAYLRGLMRLIDASAAASRARAAIAFANIRHADLAARTGISVPTLRRIVSADTPRGASIEELWAIADATRVPRAFMEHGFTQAAPAGDQPVSDDQLRNAAALLAPALLEAARALRQEPARAPSDAASQDRHQG